MQLTAGWKFHARVASMQVSIHLVAAAGFYLFLENGVILYRDAFETLFWFWLTGPLPLFLLLPLGLAVPRGAIYERAMAAATRGEICPEPEAGAARRQLMGQATYSAGMSLLQWVLNVVGGTAMLQWQNHEASERLLTGLLAGLGVFAPLVAIAVWVATDRAVRPYWPLLFPDGRASASASRRQTLDSRLLIAFVLCGPTASGLMAAIGYTKGVDILTNPSQGYFHLQSMIGMMALALGGSFVVALIFKQILASDILHGIRRLREAVERLERGERGVRVPVYDVEEIGELTERVNALAEARDRQAAADIRQTHAMPLAAAAAERPVEPTLS